MVFSFILSDWMCCIVSLKPWPLYAKQFCPHFVVSRRGLILNLELQSVLFVTKDPLLKSVLRYIGALLCTALYTMLSDSLYTISLRILGNLGLLRKGLAGRGGARGGLGGLQPPVGGGSPPSERSNQFVGANFNSRAPVGA